MKYQLNDGQIAEVTSLARRTINRMIEDLK